MKSFFLLFLCFSTYLCAQESSSIETESNRLVALCKKNGNKPDSLSFYGHKLLKLGKENNHYKAIVEGYFAQGYAASMTKNQDIFITYLDSALLYKEEIIDDHFSDVARIMRNKAIAYTKKGDFNEAEKVFKEIIAACLERNDIPSVAYNYNSLGILEKERGDFKKALKYYDKALTIWDSIGNEKSKATVFLNIGVSQSNLANYNQAITSYHHGLSLAKKHNIQKEEYRFYNNLASVYIAIEENDSANFYLEKIIPYYSKAKNNYSLSLAYMNLGQVKLNEQDLENAYLLLTQSLEGLKASQNAKSISQNYRLIAKTLYEQKKYDDALIYLDSANTLSKKHHLKVNFDKEHDLYAKLFEAQGNFQKANESLKIKDSIQKRQYVSETTNKYNQILVAQKVKNKDNTITTLKEQKTFYQSNLFFSFLIVLILAIIAFFLFKRYKSQKTEVIALQKQLDSFNDNFSKTQEEAIPPSAILKLKSKAVLNTTEILYIKSDGHYAEISLEGREKPEIERASLTSLLELLPKQDFVRIHKSYVVNIHKIKIINSTEVMLENGEWIKLSRTYKQLLKDLLNKSN
ncbi:tetratricopeptide repeat protein [Flavobacterium jejuense]|uniref:Tetratricopeptide repeat protein n=1 Tax=Flavobacterium jejuense TaxID=1544455 RepID=A0ABX0IMM4_9FLAO|nr:tetratricopeptide repeat protein [Flavobacterium jejuense]NHN24843.1 tetratricopeptide repeat protein [Flavobacterium jejuense]